MTARQSAATDRALRLVARGIPAPEAARRAKIAYTTLWRALLRNKPATQNRGASMNTTPWTDRAIDALRSDAFNVHGTIWNELRRIESSHADLLEAIEELVAEFDARNDEIPNGFYRDTGGIVLARMAIAKARAV